MKRNFVNVAKFLQDNFQDIEVEGGVYPAPPAIQFVGNILSLFQLTALACVVLGIDTVCRMLGIRQRPAWTYSVERNAMQYGILLFILAPQIVNQFSNNGAFELILDDQKEIFSKLNAGRFPTKDELINGLRAAGLQMQS